MADQVFNISKGAFAQQGRILPNAFGVILLQATGLEPDDTLSDHDDLASLLAASNTEANATNYTRKETITATVTVDDTNNRVDLDIPDQVFTALGNGQNNTLAKFVVYVEESASDAGRVPISHHDINVTTDGTDITFQIDAAGICRAS